MKGIFADSALLFEAEGYTLASATAFSLAHGQFKTQLYATQKGKITHRSAPLFHEELIPEEYDIREAIKLIFTKILAQKKPKEEKICLQCSGSGVRQRWKCHNCDGKGKIEI